MSLSQSGEALAHPRVADDLYRPQSQTAAARPLVGDLWLSLHDDLEPLREVWQAFEAGADCTIFQTFAWHAIWQADVGARTGVTPAIVVGRRGERILFILPFAIEKAKFLRRLVWHASDLCDYNGPLLAPDFAGTIGSERFPGLFDEIVRRLRADPRFGIDAIVLEKMPEMIGSQPNPLLGLRTTLHPSGAYLARLTGDWDAFYFAKRSSATRRRDRTKRKRLGDLGEVRFVTPDNTAERTANLGVLIGQKRKAFARAGIPDLFARPGNEAFFLDCAADPAMAGRVHISRLDVAGEPAALNFGLIFHGCYYHVLASYADGEASRFGPGAAHLHDLMRYAIEHGCTEFDFTIGDEPYKRDWADCELKLYDHRSAVTPIAWLASLPAAMRARGKRLIKQNAVLWPLAQKVRARLGRFSGRRPAPAAPVVDEDAEG